MQHNPKSIATQPPHVTAIAALQKALLRPNNSQVRRQPVSLKQACKTDTVNQRGQQRCCVCFPPFVEHPQKASFSDRLEWLPVDFYRRSGHGPGRKMVQTRTRTSNGSMCTLILIALLEDLDGQVFFGQLYVKSSSCS